MNTDPVLVRCLICTPDVVYLADESGLCPNCGGSKLELVQPGHCPRCKGNGILWRRTEDGGHEVIPCDQHNIPHLTIGDFTYHNVSIKRQQPTMAEPLDFTKEIVLEFKPVEFTEEETERLEAIRDLCNAADITYTESDEEEGPQPVTLDIPKDCPREFKVNFEECYWHFKDSECKVGTIPNPFEPEDWIGDEFDEDEAEYEEGDPSEDWHGKTPTGGHRIKYDYSLIDFWDTVSIGQVHTVLFLGWVTRYVLFPVYWLVGKWKVWRAS